MRGLKGRVKNQEDGTVKVECEGTRDAIEAFVEDIRIQKFPIYVEDIEVNLSRDLKGFTDFEIIREKGEDALYERLDMGAYYLREVGGKMDGLDESLGGKIDGLGKNLGGKIENLDESLGGKIVNLDRNLGLKIDNLGEKIDRFSMATSDHFNSLDSKYHIVSESLLKIAENNKKTSENLDRLVGLVEMMIKERQGEK